MLNELGRLNEQFFKFYGDIRENTENLSRKQLDFMQEKLFEQYKLEYSKIALEKDIEDKSAITSLKLRYGGFAPSKLLCFKNTAYKLLSEQINQELTEFYTKEFSEIGLNYLESKSKDNKFKTLLKKVKNLFNKKTTKTDYNLDSFSSFSSPTFTEPTQTSTSQAPKKLSLNRSNNVE